MSEGGLGGRRVLVVEDEYFLADDLARILAAAGAEVVSPVRSVAGALAALAAGTRIDAAVLDVNLHGEMVYPVADALAGRGVPFALATGYDEWALADALAGRPRLEKPLRPEKVVAALGAMLA